MDFGRMFDDLVKRVGGIFNQPQQPTFQRPTLQPARSDKKFTVKPVQRGDSRGSNLPREMSAMGRAQYFNRAIGQPYGRVNPNFDMPTIYQIAGVQPPKPRMITPLFNNDFNLQMIARNSKPFTTAPLHDIDKELNNTQYYRPAQLRKRRGIEGGRI